MGKAIIRDAVWKGILSRIRSADGSVSVGVVAGQGAEKVGEKSGANLASIALWNEFGTDTIPERSFLRATMRRIREKLNEKRIEAVTRIIEGKSTAARELGRLGAWVASEIKATIRSNVPPPNAPATIARKGSSKTLIDHGDLINGITWKVDGEGKAEV